MANGEASARRIKEAIYHMVIQRNYWSDMIGRPPAISDLDFSNGVEV